MFKIKNFEWVKNWSGNWSLLSCSIFGYQYTKALENEVGVKLKHSLSITRNGFSTMYLDHNEVMELGKKLSDKVIANKQFALELCNEIMHQTDVFMESIKERNVEKVMNSWFKFVGPNFAVKHLTDYLPADILKELLPSLTEARLYAEQVYVESEQFLRIFLNKKELLLMTKDEFEKYLKTKYVPKDLDKRNEASALKFMDGKCKLIMGSEVDAIEQEIVESRKQEDEIKGIIAYAGKVRGKVRIIFEPEKAHDFKKGEILVTGMTRPEYVPLIEKSAGFITDAGGMLSHAAIVAREMKKPCIVGTEVATKILKDGMKVELDANNGRVRILEHSERMK